MIKEEFYKSSDLIRKFCKAMGVHFRVNRNIFEHFRSLWFYYFNFFWLNIDVFGEIMFVITGAMRGENFVDLTYILPCITMCMLGNIKTYHTAAHSSQIVDLTHSLENMKFHTEDPGVIQKAFDEILPKMHKALNTLKMCNIIAMINFGMNPILVMATIYYKTNQLELHQPFYIWYPFDAFNRVTFPLVYLHQMYSAWVALFTVYGPDCLFFVTSSFVGIQFRLLQHEIRELIPEKFTGTPEEVKLFYINLRRIVNWHLELMRCVGLLETIFTKSTLFNAISSSFLICLTGFNITAIDQVPFIMTFVAFLLVTFLQIYFFCNFGDMISQLSSEVGDAVYNSRWYLLNATLNKNMLILITRSQVHCKLTALGFADINLKAFTRILSTSWSYFTLLKTMYSSPRHSS